jgi:hypothetical protein
VMALAMSPVDSVGLIAALRTLSAASL